MIKINIKKIVGKNVKGKAIVSKETICFRSEYNPVTGIVEKTHSLKGRTVKDKVLIIPSTNGSSGNSMYIRLMALEGTAPKALVCLRIDAISALGCIVNKIPLVQIDREDIFELVEDEDYIEIDGERGIITILKKEE